MQKWLWRGAVSIWAIFSISFLMGTYGFMPTDFKHQVLKIQLLKNSKMPSGRDSSENPFLSC